MDVVILAGGRCAPDLAAHTGVAHRALLPFRGRPMVEIVAEAVSSVGRVVVVGETGGVQAEVVPSGDTFVESLRNGLGAVRDSNFLLTTADLPFLTRGAVEDFVARSSASIALNYPIILAEDCAARFPGMKRTTLRLREGVFTGGNLSLARTSAMRDLLPRLERAYELRKKPVALGRLVGLPTLMRLLVGLAVPKALTIAGLEKSVSRAIGSEVRAVRTPYAEIGADIDDLTQYLSIQP